MQFIYLTDSLSFFFVVHGPVLFISCAAYLAKERKFIWRYIHACNTHSASKIIFLNCICMVSGENEQEEKKREINFSYIHAERKRNTKTHFVHCQGRRSAECRVHIIIIVVKECMCLCIAPSEMSLTVWIK